MLAKYTQSKWLKTEDLPQREKTLMNVTIDHMEEVTFEREGAPPETKIALYFSEFEKGLILNKTNIEALQELFGHDADPVDVVGKPVAVYAVKTQTPSGKSTFGMRLRAPLPDTAQQALGSQTANTARARRGEQVVEPRGFVDPQDPGIADDDVPF